MPRFNFKSSLIIIGLMVCASTNAQTDKDDSSGDATAAAEVIESSDAPEVAESSESSEESENATEVVEAATDTVVGDKDIYAEVTNNVLKHLGDFEIDGLTESPIAGVYEMISGGTIFYVNEAGTVLIEGEMIDLENRVSFTEQKLGQLHMSMIGDLPESEMLVYEPEEPTGRSITVFTDITCGYCQRLHQEIDTLLDSGVAVRYLLFPRAGLDTPAADALESVWCNDDPQAAMTTAKAGGQIPPDSCVNPIEDHVALAQQVGLRGTPLIYLDTGERIPGYRDATTIAEMVTSQEKFTP